MFNSRYALIKLLDYQPTDGTPVYCTTDRRFVMLLMDANGGTHKGLLIAKLNSKTVPVFSFLIFPFHLLPSPVHPTGFSFCFFPGFLAIFIVVSCQHEHSQTISDKIERKQVSDCVRDVRPCRETKIYCFYIGKLL